MKRLDTINWGIQPFDQISGGLPAHLISIVETPDYHSGNVVLGQYLYDGLKKGERCALITFDTANSFLENFSYWDFDFKKYLISEQFVLLNYQPNVTYEAGLTHDYDAIISEIQHLCCGEMPQRLAFQQVDAMMNLNNQILMNASAQKLSAAARTQGAIGATILGQFVNFQDKTHHDLSIALQKTVHGYFSLQKPDPLMASQYQFQVKKLPWFNFVKQPSRVVLTEVDGFQNENAVRNKVA